MKKGSVDIKELLFILYSTSGCCEEITMIVMTSQFRVSLVSQLISRRIISRRAEKLGLRVFVSGPLTAGNDRFPSWGLIEPFLSAITSCWTWVAGPRSWDGGSAEKETVILVFLGSCWASLLFSRHVAAIRRLNTSELSKNLSQAAWALSLDEARWL